MEIESIYDFQGVIDLIILDICSLLQYFNVFNCIHNIFSLLKYEFWSLAFLSNSLNLFDFSQL